MNSKTVYSTDQGRHCNKCGSPVTQCRCSNETQPANTDGIVRLHRQTKGRNGKPVTIVTGVPLAGKDLKLLAKQLKAKCGVGGSIEGSDILIQGDKRDLLEKLLTEKGYTVKKAGG